MRKGEEKCVKCRFTYTAQHMPLLSLGERVEPPERSEELG